MEWIEPKTNWNCHVDANGAYQGDYFNYTDYNRIKNNLSYLRAIALEMFDFFEMHELEDKEPGQYFYADEINRIEENLNTLYKNTYNPDGVPVKEYVDNGRIFDFNELNRLEELTLKLYGKLMGQYKSRRTLSFMLGVKGGL